jgi:hypothetical protein
VRATGDGPVLVVLAAGRARRYGGLKPLAPVGTGGEPVIDLLASDALSAGFARLVLVLGPSTGPAVRYHVEQRWPSGVDVAFCVQQSPRGTTEAVLSAAPLLANGAPFGVANADDIYGEPALALLADHLAGGGKTNLLVGFRLEAAVVGDGPVTRGVCQVDADGTLVGLEERRGVTRTAPGRFTTGDGRHPAELDGDALVSMNLWGFTPAMIPVFADAMARAVSASEEAEVLLPEVVAELLGRPSADGDPATSFRVVAADGPVIGVTHPDDLVIVQDDLARQVGRGERPARLWSTAERSRPQ